MKDASQVYNELLNIVNIINDYNDNYPRRVGTMVMISATSEDKAQQLVNSARELIRLLQTEEMIKQVDADSIINFNIAIKKIEIFLDQNQEEIDNDRNFLEKYNC